jgi:hypothetical protein
MFGFLKTKKRVVRRRVGAAAPTQAGAAAPPVDPNAPTINIGEEFGTAKKNLPPVKIVLIAVGVVLVVVLIASFIKRAKPQGAGSLDTIVPVDITGQGSTMVALTFTLSNTSDKILYVHNVQAKITEPTGELTADAVSSIDFDRYFQAFPALKEGIQPALSPEVKVQPGESVKRSIIVAFPVTLDVFYQRKSTSVLVWPYDQSLPITLTK